MDKDDDTPVSLAKDPADLPPASGGAVAGGDAAAGDDATAGDDAPAASPGFSLGPRAEAFVGGAAYGALGLLGAVVGLVGSFAQDWTVGSIPLAAILFVLLTFGVVRAAGWAMGTRLGALIPALTWGVVVFLLSQRRPEGDLVVPGNLPGYVYLVGGMTAAVIAIAMVPARMGSGSWLLRGADRTAG